MKGNKIGGHARVDFIVRDNNGQRVFEKIPEGILECPSEARDWHTTLGKGVRIRCPLFSDRPSCMYASVPVCGTCLDALEEPWWIRRVVTLVSSGKQRNRRTPKAHGRFCVLVCVSTYSAMPVRVDITVGSVDSNRYYSRCTACVAERALRDSVSSCISFKFRRWILTRVNYKSTRCIALPISFDRSI